MKIKLNESKIKTIVSEVLKNVLNENSFQDQEEYTVDDFINDFKETRETLLSINDDDLYSAFSSLESDWFDNQEQVNKYGESIDNSYFSQFKNFKDYCQEWIYGVLTEKYGK